MHIQRKNRGKGIRPSTFKIYKILTFIYKIAPYAIELCAPDKTSLHFGLYRKGTYTHIHLSIFIMERTEYKVEVKQAIVSRARLLTSHFLNEMDRVE